MLVGPMYSLNASMLFFDRSPRDIPNEEILELFEHEKNQDDANRNNTSMQKSSTELETLARNIHQADNNHRLFSKLNLFKQMSGNP